MSQSTIITIPCSFGTKYVPEYHNDLSNTIQYNSQRGHDFFCPPQLNGVTTFFDPQLNGVATFFDPRVNGVMTSFDPRLNGVATFFDPQLNGLTA